jgi:hypothetical protein
VTDLKKLRNISDTVLSNMTVTNELKEKTIDGLNRKRILWTKTVLVPTACAAALVAVVCTGVLSPKGVQAPQTSSGINTMAAVEWQTSTPSQDSTFSPGTQVLESWNVNTTEDAKGYMGGKVLTPSYIPQEYKLKEIIAAGPAADNVIAIMMEFDSNGRSFMITQDKGVTKKVNSGNSKEVDINGVTASVDSTSFNNGETTIYSTTVRWYVNDFMYAVQGSISEEEAIKVAQSLK